MTPKRIILTILICFLGAPAIVLLMLSGIAWLNGSGGSVLTVFGSILLAPVGTVIYFPYLLIVFIFALTVGRLSNSWAFKSVFGGIPYLPLTGGAVVGGSFPIYLKLFSDPALTLGSSTTYLIIGVLTGIFVTFVTIRIWK